MESLRNGNIPLSQEGITILCIVCVCTSSGSNTFTSVCPYIILTSLKNIRASTICFPKMTELAFLISVCSYRWAKAAECSQSQQCVKHCWPYIILTFLKKIHASTYCWQAFLSLVPRPHPEHIPLYMGWFWVWDRDYSDVWNTSCFSTDECKLLSIVSPRIVSTLIAVS